MTHRTAETDAAAILYWDLAQAGAAFDLDADSNLIVDGPPQSALRPEIFKALSEHKTPWSSLSDWIG